MFFLLLMWWKNRTVGKTGDKERSETSSQCSRNCERAVSNQGLRLLSQCLSDSQAGQLRLVCNVERRVIPATKRGLIVPPHTDSIRTAAGVAMLTLNDTSIQ